MNFNKTLETGKEKIKAIDIKRKLEDGIKYIGEHGEEIVKTAYVLGIAYYLFSMRIDNHKYNKARVKLMKAEAKSKEAYARHFKD